LADLYEEHVGGQRGHDKAIAALQRYLEARPDDRDGWMRLSALRREVGDDFGALQAQLEMASRGGAPYADVSNAANRLNALLRDGTLKADVTERRMVIERVRDVMVRRIAEANATDCSRLAWLCLHLGDKGGAHAYVGRGLELDPNNQHCLGLAHRLEDD
jgi:tetratricopeptide (TPR) repeat protein